MTDTLPRTPAHRGARRRRRLRGQALATAVAMLAAVPLAWTTGGASAAPVGQGFALNASDLRFVLKQIKIAERHADTRTAGDPCGTLLGSAVDQIPAAGQGVELPWGLRTVDGTCNNLVKTATRDQSTYGAADQKFPRLVPAQYGPSDSGSYAAPGTVTDSHPRVVSNLVVDQTAANPAAVDAAGEVPETTPSGAFMIPNVAPDVGLSAPYNSWFTLFGQFFDHGLDLVNKGGRGNVFMPLKSDDPLFSTAPGAPNFMVLTRATAGADGEATNQTSPFVDQSQTYTSHPSHQVFLREYANDAAGKPQPNGQLITAPAGGMATWADAKLQARTVLGIDLKDSDALSIPLVATDPYGRFERGPNGFPQLVVPTAPNGLVEGNPAAPVSTTGATPSGHAFLDDIAHHAVPGLVDHDHNPGTPRVVAVPDADPGTVDDNDGTTYDDEMLNAHFIAGDGRVNENIGLISVHHVFHSEHNRLVDEIDAMVSTQLTDAEEADWRATDRYTVRDGGYDYGERLFQAARFVTEMEYQHLAFEEFIRKVQPLVNPFGEGGTGYNTSINPAIRAEFAHAVYRFGHSMLTESVDRIRANGTRDDIPLLTAFLNPPAFMAGSATPEQAAGNVVRGMTRQVGNELDEFVTEALRNQLLGLPLDLASLNLARARDTGVPTLNAARRSFYEASNNSALAPYQSWADLSFSLKHAQSLNNFIAAYGTHDSITGATTLAGKRAAADALVYGTNGRDGEPGTADDIASVPEDRYAFLNGTPHETTDPGTLVVTEVHRRWVSGANGVTTTGVDAIDLWVGGLAEKQMVFGGLLGPTFNYVFEAQAEDLQFGDRFYYLARTAGLNMLTQLEGNSFAELISRNTDVSGLPADSFSRPDYVFDVAKLGTSGAVLDDPDTTYNESTMLTRMPDGTIRYGGPAHVVFNGTEGNNRVWSSEGDDTIRGNDGNDWMQGGDGNDNHVGGLGDDILLDSNGDDTLKGGDGHDVLSSGQGFGGDLNQGGRGNDFVVTGNDAAETFAGPGDDYVTGGAGDDTVFGDDGDDWIESGASVTGTGGGAFNLLQGDNGAPFQDDPNEPGHDVLIGYGGESDYDAEGGDDVMLMGPGIQRSEGMLGFDYSTHESDTAPADSDMAFTGLLPPSVETNRDRFDLVEALSGGSSDDTLRGDDRDAAAMVDHELTAAGIARVNGLAALLPAAAIGFTGGNLLMGGAGSDVVEGRGGNDLIDGDAFLNVRISVRDRVEEPTVEVESVETMRQVQARVLAGTINPGRLRIVREVLTPANGTAVDVAVFSGPRADYDTTVNADGSLTVAHDAGAGIDGTDTVRNVETLRFSDGDVAVASLSAPAPDTTAPPAPSVDPAGGTFTTAQTVTMSNTETDAVIRFTRGAGTTVPADPTAASEAYSGPFTVSSSSVIKAAAFDAAGNVSPVTQRSYTISAPADTTAPPAPDVALASGTYTGAQSTTMSVGEAGAVIRYTIEPGTTVPADPTVTSTQYDGVIGIGSSQVLKAAAFDAAGNRSPITQRNYTINTATTRPLVVTAADDTMARQSAPTTTSGAATTLFVDSQIGTNTSSRDTSYVRFNVPALAAGESITGAALSLNVTNGTANGPAVWRTDPVWTEGTMTWNSGRPARIGTAAVGNYGSMATGRINTPVIGVTGAGQVSFELFADATDGIDFASSETGTVANRPQLVLTISGTSGGGGTPPAADTTPPPAPSVSLASGTYTGAQSTTMSVVEAGAVIRYTTGPGTTVPPDPTATSTQYTGVVPIGSSQVLKAAAFDAAGNRSPITQRNYTINTAAPTTRPLVVTAADDTMARQSAPTTTSGAATTLFVDSQIGTNTSSRDTSYVRFNVPALAAGESIAGAALSLNVTNGTANGPSVWRTDPVWTEGTMTWNSGRPARIGTAAVGNYGSMATGRINTPVIGVTGAGQVSFELFADATDGIDFASSETGTVANRPQLVLTISTS